MDYPDLVKAFPDSSGNLRMNNFNPAWFMLENYKTVRCEVCTTTNR